MDYLEIFNEKNQRFILWCLLSIFSSLFIILGIYCLVNEFTCKVNTKCYLTNSIGLISSIVISIILFRGFKKLDGEIVNVQKSKDYYLMQLSINKELENLKIIKSLKLTHNNFNLSPNLKFMLGIKDNDDNEKIKKETK